MKPLFHPHLVNDPFEDPALYIDFLFQKRALLFDLGELQLLPSRKILRLSDVFVSHTHMDHFSGFDRLARILLARDKRLRLFGPPGFIDRVEHRLASYTWNLVDNYPVDFTLSVGEFDGQELRCARFRCRNRFGREGEETLPVVNGILLDEETFRIRSAVLDHKTPCLAFALEEKSHLNIMKDRLLKLGLSVGPWLTELKTAVLRGDSAEALFRVWWREEGVVQERLLELEFLKREIVRIVPGQKITYVTDVACTPENVFRIKELAAGSDYLFIEAMFLHEDEARARAKYHLTARQAGMLAWKAGAVRVIPFHFSAKYAGQGEELRREVVEAFVNQEEWGASCFSRSEPSSSKVS